MKRSDARRFPSSIDPRLERMHHQWVSRRLREPGLVRGRPLRDPGRPLLGGGLLDLWRGKKDVAVIVQLAPGAAAPKLLKASGGSASSILVGYINLEDLEPLSRDPTVLRVEASRRHRLALAHSVPAIQADAAQLGAALPSLEPTPDGTGVIVGILDEYCDVDHPNFKHPDGTTRILYWWRQGDPPEAGSPPTDYKYGVEFDSAAINRALKAKDPYGKELGNFIPGPEGHGTHVMDIAAGNGRCKDSHPGVAPRAGLIFVEVDSSDAEGRKSIVDSTRLIDAVDYVFKQADARGMPAVVNISLGTNGGPHDGTSLMDHKFEALLATPGRAIVIAAGNGFTDRCHAAGRIAPSGDHTLTWEIAVGDDTGNELEIWYSGGPLNLYLRKPGAGKETGPVKVGDAKELRASLWKLWKVDDVVHGGRDPGNGLRHIDLVLQRGATPGPWSVRLENAGKEEAVFNAWIERDGEGETQSRFSEHDARTSTTLTSTACGMSSIVVGSYASSPAPAVSTFSAAGKTRDGRKKPDVSAPGEHVSGQGIRAANSQGGLTRYSGTSQAAPHVSGLVALMMQAALPGRLSIEDIRDALCTTAIPGPDGDWDDRTGHGRIDATAAIKKVVWPRAPRAGSPSASS